MDLRLPFELFTEWQATCWAECGTCGFFWTMHGVSAPSCCAFIHRFSFVKVSGHHVLIKSRPGNRGLSDCGTTHEAMSRTSSWDRPHPEVRPEGREPLADREGAFSDPMQATGLDDRQKCSRDPDIFSKWDWIKRDYGPQTESSQQVEGTSAKERISVKKVSEQCL